MNDLVNPCPLRTVVPIAARLPCGVFVPAPSAAESLDIWHLAQEFGTRPVLGDTFITDKPPIDRIIAVPTEPQFLWMRLLLLIVLG